MTVRTRVAPSPTGDPHVGTGYVALFNYCFAKAHGGEFILRIEDTDRARSTLESEQMILDSLRWLGLSWDEGPDVGGPSGPYRQSERGDIYAEHAQVLLAAGHAYRCFHTPEELSAMRADGPQQGFKSQYRDLDAAESAARAERGDAFVVRMKVPTEGTCTVQDRLRGVIEIDYAQVDEQVLVKSDGMPTYHMANVVDDHLMGITHVLRGEEWISSAPKHLLLYQYFGWDAPELCHLPLLRNPDKSKLSKRKNPTSIRYYERMGFLPEALLNYLGRMAWSMPDERERFDLAEMIEHFDLDRVSLGGPVFDVTKLSWLNGVWIREALDDRAFADAVRRWALNEDFLLPLIPLVRERVNRLSDLGPMLSFFFAGDLEPTAESLAVKGREPDEVRQALVFTQWHLEGVDTWDAATINTSLRDLAAMTAIKLRDLLGPMFVALTGSKSSTPLFQTMEHLGRDMTRARLRTAIDALGGLSGKQSAKWRKVFDALEAPAAAE